MIRRDDNSFEIRLTNAEGVPILRVCGTVTKAALRAVKLTLDRLAGAGHFNVVLNLERANAANWRFLTGLAGAVRNIRSHYGHVDLVATQDRIQQLLGIGRIATLFRFSKSEREAISRIKGLSRPPDGSSSANARLVEKR